MSVINSIPLIAAGDDGGYQISRSVRLRSSASAYFNRTPASASNRKTWTWSGWVKRGGLPSSGYYSFLGADSGAGSSFYIAFDNSTQQLEFGQGATVYRKTTQVFRDPSAWYHLVIHSDTTQATASNRLKIYVNGLQVTTFATSNDPSLNGDWALNNNVAHAIGADTPTTGARNFFDGYLTEINFIDGQALTPSSFGENDAVTGVWKPKRYAGTYGTNGFYLNFSDNSAATAAAIGKDSSGNGNNWTPNNISVTAGATYDSMLDVPTPYADGGNGRGNYCVLNPLDWVGAANTITNGNLDITTSASTITAALGTVFVSSGKWYFEFIPSGVAGVCQIGVAKVPVGTISTNGAAQSANAYTYLSSNGNKGNNNTFSAYGATYTSSDVIGVALDLDVGTLVFYKNGTSQGTAYTGLAGEFACIVSDTGNASTVAGSANFGQRPFAYTPPTGFKALNTQNLPDSTIKKGNAYFDATTYTGTGSALSITNTASFQPDLVWIKGRSGATDHALYDAVRGTTLDLVSNSTAAETTQATGLTAFNSNGFTVGALAKLNTSSATYVGWQWKESATAGFDIVTQTAPASGNVTINHNLGVTPSFVIIKARSGGVANWPVWIQGIGTDHLNLNTTGARSASGYMISQNSTTFVFNGGLVYPSNPFVSYLFAEVAGFSKFGSYTGNGSADGPFVYCGFRPKFILIKSSTNLESWLMLDSTRSSYNVAGNWLYPNASNAEGSGLSILDFTSNGIKIRYNAADLNTSGQTYIYAAFAENPFKNSLAR